MGVEVVTMHRLSPHEELWRGIGALGRVLVQGTSAAIKASKAKKARASALDELSGEEPCGECEERAAELRRAALGGFGEEGLI